MPAKVGRRDRRAIDASLVSTTAPAQCLLEHISSEITGLGFEVHFGVLSQDGSAVYDTSAWTSSLVPGITLDGNPATQAEMFEDHMMLAFGVYDLSGPLLLTFPAWSETFRGPNGEWIAGGAVYVDLTGEAIMNLDPFAQIEVDGNEIVLKFVDSAGNPLQIVCPCIPSITVDGNPPVIASTELGGTQLRLTYAASVGTGEDFELPKGVSCLRGINGEVPLASKGVIP